MINWTIDLGVIVQIIVVIGAIIGFWRKSISDKNKEFAIATLLHNDMIYVKEKVKNINDLVTSRAVMETQILHLQEDIRLLRTGQGFIKNTLPSTPGVNREYGGG